MRTNAWLVCLTLAIAGCPGAPGTDAGMDAGMDAGTDATVGRDGGIDASTGRDAGTDAPLPSDAGLDAVSPDAAASADAADDAIVAHDAAPRPDTNADAGLFCPIGGLCTLGSGGAGHCCLGECVDLAADDANCGACGVPCGPGRHCRNGRCEHPSCAGVVSSGDLAHVDSFCPLADGTTGTCCDGTCRAAADFATDARNCGACGHLCPTGRTCGGGSCGLMGCDETTGAGCPSGAMCAYGATCERVACAGVADGTVCSIDYGHDGVCCAGACVDTALDPANCGACGTACPAGTACAGTCITAAPCGTPDRLGAACVMPSGHAGTCCGSRCVDLGSDDADCFECGIACPIGQSCDGGHLCVAPLPDGGLAQTGCATDADCPSGHHCHPGVPWNFCWRDTCADFPDGTSCGAPGLQAGICCGGACVDSVRDPNCGGCGSACSSGVCALLSASGGGPTVTCLPDTASATDCSGAGGCPAGSACVAGVCMTTTCAAFGTFCRTAGGGAGQCCSSACADLATDPMHCGSCFTACTAAQACVRGRCTP